MFFSKDGFLQRESKCTKFAREINISEVSVFHVTTPFSGCLDRRIYNLVEHLQWRFFAEILNFLGPLKMVLWEISQNSQENICAGISFFDKVKLCRSAASLKTRLYSRCFLVDFPKFAKTLFLQNTTRQLLLILAISTINYFRKKSSIADVWLGWK